MIRPALAAAALALAGCAPTESDEADLRSLAEARPVGEPVDCIETSRISRTRVRGDQAIDFHLRSGEVFRNTLRNRCPGLGFEDSFTYRASIGKLCSVDFITVINNSGGQGPSCGLGSFQRIETAAR